MLVKWVDYPEATWEALWKLRNNEALHAYEAQHGEIARRSGDEQTPDADFLAGNAGASSIDEREPLDSPHVPSCTPLKLIHPDLRDGYSYPEP